MKLVLRALAIAALSTNLVCAASAGAKKCNPSRFTGFFAGLNLGMSSISTKESEKVAGVKTESREGGFGPSFGLHAGYGVGFGAFGYVGTSLYGNFGNTKIGGGNYKRTHAMGLNFDVGMAPLAGNTLIGVGAGREWAKFKAKSLEEKSQSKTKFGFRPSLFAKTFVTQNLYVGLRGSIGMFGKVGKKAQTWSKNTNDTAVTVEVGYKF
jgi:hypothetical protein